MDVTRRLSNFMCAMIVFQKTFDWSKKKSLVNEITKIMDDNVCRFQCKQNEHLVSERYCTFCFKGSKYAYNFEESTSFQLNTPEWFKAQIRQWCKTLSTKREITRIGIGCYGNKLLDIKQRFGFTQYQRNIAR